MTMDVHRHGTDIYAGGSQEAGVPLAVHNTGGMPLVNILI